MSTQEPNPEIFNNWVSAIVGTMERNPNGCGCHACNPRAGWFVVCDECGSKRCPKATHHDELCTSNNAPGQPGSCFGGLEPTVCQVRLTPEYLRKFGYEVPAPPKPIDKTTSERSRNLVILAALAGWSLSDWKTRMGPHISKDVPFKDRFGYLGVDHQSLLSELLKVFRPDIYEEVKNLKIGEWEKVVHERLGDFEWETTP